MKRLRFVQPVEILHEKGPVDERMVQAGWTVVENGDCVLYVRALAPHKKERKDGGKRQ